MHETKSDGKRQNAAGYLYVCTEPVDKNFSPDFKPELTPKQMLVLGCFGGVYMRDCTKEFPKEWFVKAKLQRKELKHQDPKLNYFGIKASQPLSVWRKKGWIYKDDPRGWFQWYCRYYMGRRIPEEDERQIKRWRAMARHVAQVTATVMQKTRHVAPNSVRHFCTGHTIVESSKSIYEINGSGRV